MDWYDMGKSLLVGESINIHHCKQGSGNDKFYITRTEDAILCYCHHCGYKGGRRLTSNGVKAYKKPMKLGRYPTDGLFCLASWPAWARVWVSKAGLNQEDIDRHMIQYSKSHDQVILPVMFDGELRGYQYRNSPTRISQRGYAKYLSRDIDTGGLVSLIIIRDACLAEPPKGSCKHRYKQLVLVEDILSSIKIYKAFINKGEGLGVLALLGTSLKDIDKLLPILTEYKLITIYLDDDNHQVKMKQINIKKKLSMFHRNIRIIRSNGVDPKEQTTDQLYQQLRG